MSARQAKRARSLAYQWASRNGVWAKYPAPTLSKLRAILRRIFDFLFRRAAEARKRGEEKQRGWWYRRVLKAAAHHFANPTVKREAEEFARARKKINRNHAQRREAERSKRKEVV